ncbi:esterase family protein [Nonomuraea sp. MG754425]|uniref:alpha/beta hydrolase n=1 Tax=Nonomuraea sp. MG754425 TaxID=2570319 RepID=UPI001F334DD4|nr:alpha/beta hydrolase family protein [Nonomuraea sp. MG754425]MCF6476186.1 esterase family protein [Nonomuraea sp. MG754425]
MRPTAPPTASPTRRPSARPVARGLAAALLVLSGVRASPAHADPDWSLVPDDSSGQSSARPTAPPAPDTGYLPWQKALSGPARVVRERRLDARTLDVLISSRAVGRLLPVRLLLPKGWSKSAKRTWPVLYLLHGGADDYTSWTRRTDVAAYTAGLDAIVVMPEAGRAGNYSDWHNGGRGGPPAWATFHTDEVRRLLEVGYRAGTRRAIAGLSMGAYGAVKYAARYRGMFRFAGAYSGILATRLPGIPAVIMNAQAGEKQNPLALWGDPERDRRVWAANDPLALVANLKGVSLYLSSGTNSFNGPLDPPGSPWHPAHLGEPLSAYTGRALSERLKRLGIPHTLHLYGNGTHTWPYWIREFKTSYPMIRKALGV